MCNGKKIGYRLCDSPQGLITQLTEVPNLSDVWIACFEDTDEDEPFFYCSLFVYNLTADRRFHCWLLGDSKEPLWTFDDEKYAVVFTRADGTKETINIQEKLQMVDSLKVHLDD